MFLTKSRKQNSLTSNVVRACTTEAHASNYTRLSPPLRFRSSFHHLILHMQAGKGYSSQEARGPILAELNKVTFIWVTKGDILTFRSKL